jgi:hypothetical protein
MNALSLLGFALLTQQPAPAETPHRLGLMEWHRLPSTGTPPPRRTGHTLAYDEQHQALVMYGGWPCVGLLFVDETWVWKESTWTRMSPATTPGIRPGPAMAYDARRGKVVLYNPVRFTYPSTQTLSDSLWEWDGTNWTEHAATGPGPRRSMTMTYDSLRQRVRMFGGQSEGSSPGALLSDQWMWDGSAWEQVTQVNPPTFGSWQQMVHDARRDRLVLLGLQKPASPSEPSPPIEHWEWDGTAWSQRALEEPRPTRWGQLVQDEQTGRVLFFETGAAQGTAPVPVWAWDGTRWSKLTARSGEAPRRPAGSGVYDRTRKSVLFFGEQSLDTCATDTLWEYRFTAPLGTLPLKEGVALEFTPVGEAPGATVVQASGLPEGATFDAARQLFSWTPSYTQAGQYTVTFQLSEGQQTSSHPVRLEVQNMNRPPVVKVEGHTRVDAEHLLEFRVSGSDPDGEAVTLSVGELPHGARFDAATGTFSWKPHDSDVGYYDVVFTGSDGELSTRTTAKVFVAANSEPLPQPPAPPPHSESPHAHVGCAAGGAGTLGGAGAALLLLGWLRAARPRRRTTGAR